MSLFAYHPIMFLLRDSGTLNEHSCHVKRPGTREPVAPRRTLTASRGSRAHLRAYKRKSARERVPQGSRRSNWRRNRWSRWWKPRNIYFCVWPLLSEKFSLPTETESLLLHCIAGRAAHPRPTTNVDCHFFFFRASRGRSRSGSICKVDPNLSFASCQD